MATQINVSKKQIEQCYFAMTSAIIIAVIMFVAILTRPPHPFTIPVWFCFISSLSSSITLYRLAASLKKR